MLKSHCCCRIIFVPELDVGDANLLRLCERRNKACRRNLCRIFQRLNWVFPFSLYSRQSPPPPSACIQWIGRLFFTCTCNTARRMTMRESRKVLKNVERQFFYCHLSDEKPKAQAELCAPLAIRFLIANYCPRRRCNLKGLSQAQGRPKFAEHLRASLFNPHKNGPFGAPM